MSAPPATSSCPSCNAPASGRFCANCGAPLEGAVCAGCAASLSRGAKFCHRCGTAVGATPVGRRDSGGISGALPWAVAGIALVALISLVAAQRFRPQSAGGSLDGSSNALPQQGLDDRGGGADAAPPQGAMRAPDISSMTPRERADRLYDRIMRYHEAGKTDSLEFFAPMAISAFQLLGDLDSDARYDMGRVAELAGALPFATAQADTILRANQTHLLGLALAMRTAGEQGQTGPAKDFAARLIADAPTERRKGLPEYERHKVDIDEALAEARDKWVKR